MKGWLSKKAVSLLFLGVMLLFGLSAGAQKRLKAVCTLPTVEAIAREVGGNRVEVLSLAKGDQDPHFVSPTPVLMKKAREADFLLEVGLSLELWADDVANGSGNPKIFRLGPGRVVTSTGIPALEIPALISREYGDIHPQGNPHLWLDPLRAKLMAANIAEAFQRAAPENKDYFAARALDFQDRIDRALFGEELVRLVGSRKLTRLAWDNRLFPFLAENEVGGEKLLQKLGGWLKRAQPLRGLKAVEYHKVWVYFAHLFGLDLRGTIEERPGIPPGPQYQRRLIEQVKREGVQLILVDNFYSMDLPNYIVQQTGARAVLLPNQVRGERGVNTYFDLIDHILDRLLEAAKGGPSEGGGHA